MTDTKLSDQPRLLNDLIESLGQASGATSQLIHMHQDPRWMMIRDALDLAREGCIGLATFQARKVTPVKPL